MPAITIAVSINIAAITFTLAFVQAIVTKYYFLGD
jgi:hypothetical protein